MSRNRQNAKQKEVKRSVPFILIGGVLVAAIALALLLFRSNDSGNSSNNSANNAPRGTTAAVNTSDTVGSNSSTPPGAVAAGAQPPHIHGDPNAPITLEEFGDYQCPPCGLFHPEVKKLETQYGKRLKVVFRNLPLPTIHEHAVDAARAAEAAGLQGKFWEMHDLLYQQQNVWKNEADVRSLFATYARALGLDVERFKSDMDSSAVTARLNADKQRADSLGFTGTPSIMVNNREITGDTLQDIFKNTRDSIAEAANNLDK